MTVLLSIKVLKYSTTFFLIYFIQMMWKYIFKFYKKYIYDLYLYLNTIVSTKNCVMNTF